MEPVIVKNDDKDLLLKCGVLEYLAETTNAGDNWAQLKATQAFKVSCDATQAWNDAKLQRDTFLALKKDVIIAQHETLNLAFPDVAALEEEAKIYVAELEKEATGLKIQAEIAHKAFQKISRNKPLNKSPKKNYLSISKLKKEKEGELEQTYELYSKEPFVNSEESLKLLNDNDLLKDDECDLSPCADNDNTLNKTITTIIENRRKHIDDADKKANELLKDAGNKGTELNTKINEADQFHKCLRSTYSDAYNFAGVDNYIIILKAKEVIDAWNLVIKLGKSAQVAWEDAGKAVRCAHITKAKWGKSLLIIAEKGKGNFGLGSAAEKDAKILGKAWVNRGSNGYKHDSVDNDILISNDDKYQFRRPKWKIKDRKWCANFERNRIPGIDPAKYFHNGHLDILDMDPYRYRL